MVLQTKNPRLTGNRGFFWKFCSVRSVVSYRVAKSRSVKARVRNDALPGDALPGLPNLLGLAAHRIQLHVKRGIHRVFNSILPRLRNSRLPRLSKKFLPLLRKLVSEWFGNGRGGGRGSRTWTIRIKRGLTFRFDVVRGKIYKQAISPAGTGIGNFSVNLFRKRPMLF